jgi:alpha-glucan,water dikinase
MAVADKITPSLVGGIKDEIKDEEIFYEQEFQLDNGHHLAALVSKDQDRYRTRLITDMPGPLILHWGVANRSRVGWALPAPHLRPEGTTVFQNTAAQTGFSDR